MDRRVKYLLGVDTETCNGQEPDLSCSLVYDVGWCITDKRGRIYLERSFVVREIFFGLSDVMKSAYYAKKIPRYLADIREGKRQVKSLLEIYSIFKRDCKDWNVQAIFAHNARFDYTALNTTLRLVTCSRMRYFFPYGVEIWDTLKMSRQTIAKQVGYQLFCEKYGYTLKTGKPRTTAEVLTRYLTGNVKFQESHTGLEDVQIETKILAQCIKQHKKMEKRLFPNRELTNWPAILIWKKQHLNMAWG